MKPDRFEARLRAVVDVQVAQLPPIEQAKGVEEVDEIVVVVVRADTTHPVIVEVAVVHVCVVVELMTVGVQVTKKF